MAGSPAAPVRVANGFSRVTCDILAYSAVNNDLKIVSAMLTLFHRTGNTFREMRLRASNGDSEH